VFSDYYPIHIMSSDDSSYAKIAEGQVKVELARTEHFYVKLMEDTGLDWDRIQIMLVQLFPNGIYDCAFLNMHMFPEMEYEGTYYSMTAISDFDKDEILKHYRAAHRLFGKVPDNWHAHLIRCKISGILPYAAEASVMPWNQGTHCF